MKTTVCQRENILLQLKLSRQDLEGGIIQYWVDDIEYHVSHRDGLLHIDAVTLLATPDLAVICLLADMYGEETIMFNDEEYEAFPPLDVEPPAPTSKPKKKYKAIKTLGLVVLGAAVTLGGYVAVAKFR